MFRARREGPEVAFDLSLPGASPWCCSLCDVSKKCEADQGDLEWKGAISVLSSILRYEAGVVPVLD